MAGNLFKKKTTKSNYCIICKVLDGFPKFLVKDSFFEKFGPVMSVSAFEQCLTGGVCSIAIGYESKVCIKWGDE